MYDRPQLSWGVSRLHAWWEDDLSELAPSDLAYPVLCLSHDGSISVVREAAALGRCSAHALWRTRYYDKLRVFDADARSFVVRSATPVRAYSAPARWIAGVTNARVEVELRLAPTGESSLAEAKRLVLASLARNSDLWEADGTTADDRRRRIDAAQSVVSIMREVDPLSFRPAG